MGNGVHPATARQQRPPVTSGCWAYDQQRHGTKPGARPATEGQDAHEMTRNGRASPTFSGCAALPIVTPRSEAATKCSMTQGRPQARGCGKRCYPFITVRTHAPRKGTSMPLLCVFLFDAAFQPDRGGLPYLPCQHKPRCIPSAVRSTSAYQTPPLRR